MTKSTISLATLVSFLSNLLILSAAQHPNATVYSNCSLGKGTYTNSSVFHTNLNALLSNVAFDTKIDYGFCNSSYGENPNKVNAIGLCRGDVKPETCRSCLKNATMILPKQCPNQMEAFGCYDFSTGEVARVHKRGFWFEPWKNHFEEELYDGDMWQYKVACEIATRGDEVVTCGSEEKAQDAEKYTKALDDLMESLKGKAAAGDSRVKVAMGNATAAPNETVFGLAQCTPEFSQQDCEDCLRKAISDIPICCQNRIGGRVIKLSCNLRFEKGQFYDSIQLSPIPPALAPSSRATSSPPAGVSDSPKAADDSPKASEGNSVETSRIVAIVAVVIGALTTIY
ncbi:cysteine-rich repeat secretory protein 38-like [Neltuma alba]|uniref:cysteine-rich repeat secretory protein 38-like n=1 Tax=Neltuma alba TaxID=207710 RepID=UPI0010A3E6CF|nr:cysteine-rich repeat secretory protein 38-like [Prosopis alba]